jgi:hypothetical protein
MLEDFTSRAKDPQHTPAFLFNRDCEGQTHRRREALRFGRPRLRAATANGGDTPLP